MTPLAGYELHERIGSGGIGEVYRASQKSTGASVAIKFVGAVDGQSAAWRRVERELRALVTLTGHAHVIGVIEVVPTENGRALVVELASGGSLAQLASEGRVWSVADVIMVGVQVADALQAAHDRGIVHRDIKPQNVLVDSYGQAKVCDFGIASLLRSDEFKDRTSSLSYRYASPEDVEDEEELVGPPADVYSLGATLLFLRRGAPPTSLERVSGWVPVLDPNDPIATELDQIIADCLSVEPFERPRIGVVRDRLERLQRRLERPTRSLLAVEPDLFDPPRHPRAGNVFPPSPGTSDKHRERSASTPDRPNHDATWQPAAPESEVGSAAAATSSTDVAGQASPRSLVPGSRNFAMDQRSRPGAPPTGAPGDESNFDATATPEAESERLDAADLSPIARYGFGEDDERDRARPAEPPTLDPPAGGQPHREQPHREQPDREQPDQLFTSGAGGRSTGLDSGDLPDIGQPDPREAGRQHPTRYHRPDTAQAESFWEDDTRPRPDEVTAVDRDAVPSQSNRRAWMVVFVGLLAALVAGYFLRGRAATPEDASEKVGGASTVVSSGATGSTAPAQPSASSTGDVPTDSKASGSSVDAVNGGLELVRRPFGLPPLDKVDRPLVASGTCLVEEGNPASLNETDCSNPHDLQLIFAFVLAEPVTLETVNQAANLRCAEQFIELVHQGDLESAKASQLTVEATVPDVDGFAKGDRDAQCWVTVPDQRIVGDAYATGW